MFVWERFLRDLFWMCWWVGERRTAEEAAE